MTQTLDILASCRSERVAEAIRSGLSGVDGLRLEVLNGTLSDAVPRLASAEGADVMIVDLDLVGQDDLAALGRIMERQVRPVPIIATGGEASVQRIRTLMRLGVVDWLPQPIARDDLLSSVAVAAEALTEADAPEVESVPAEGRGRLVLVTRACGGMGATSIAIQTAYAAANEGKQRRKVCLVDLDLQASNVGLYLDIEAPATVADCLAAGDRIDGSLVQATVTRHKAGFDVLTAPGPDAVLEAVDAAALDRLVGALTADYDLVLVDMPPFETGWTRHLTARADALVLVTQLTVAGIRRAGLFCRRLGSGPTVSVVANRARKSMFGGADGDISIKQAEKALGHAIDALVPSDFPTLSRAINEGKPVPMVAKRTPFEKAVRRFAETLGKRLEADGGRPQARKGR